MKDIKEVLGNNNLIRELKKNIVSMSMDDENITNLFIILEDCYTVYQESIVEENNIWTEHPAMAQEDPNFQKIMELRKVAANAQLINSFILNHLKIKLSPEKYNLFCKDLNIFKHEIAEIVHQENEEKLAKKRKKS